MKSKLLKTIALTLISVNTIVYPIYAAEVPKFSNLNDVEENIYTHLINRDSNINFIYTGSTREFKDNIVKTIKAAYSKDDYTERSWLEIKPNVNISDGKINTSINFEYLTNKEQEEFIDIEIKKITDKLINDKMSDFEKVKAINDYLANRYEYDYTLSSSNVYSALITNYTVCQGYSLTAYKMLKNAGIESRIGVGTNKGASHSWNIVKIEDSWYHLDITNNDSTRSNKYFLVSDKFLEDNNYKWNRTEYPEALNNK
ncbi:transglutaminase domain-containing protein [Clostridium botulinum]|uniref:S-layer protein n=2 Tax=Clostridium botulinum TaxID=1491 RepID=B2TSD0_CLOBB|nr:transglutaminase-like domain-containing protein [Clostridium botulinum]ACD14164.1 S-layer protein [Clostridium botulinum B str. Eklund 17B (NRP)]AIW54475.1 putative transglutaminase family protein [Clostridium botulinum]AIW54529.1 putative transglutaminase family protein [Clostridium botulinum]MBY6977842.1 transglutaminase domain-containing protein [Clostridium botulinum]MBY7002325.1 transglutaminase domain-containing protein [Clostridium botulinum]